MKTALIFGVTGQDGSYLVEFLLKKKYKVYTTGKKKRSYNLNDFTIIKKKILNINPDIIINSAGLTDIEICENKPSLSKKIALFCLIISKQRFSQISNCRNYAMRYSDMLGFNCQHIITLNFENNITDIKYYFMIIVTFNDDV